MMYRQLCTEFYDADKKYASSNDALYYIRNGLSTLLLGKSVVKPSKCIAFQTIFSSMPSKNNFLVVGKQQKEFSHNLLNILHRFN